MKASLPKWVLYSVGSAWVFTCVLLVFLLHTSESLRPQPQGTWLLTHIVNPSEATSASTIEYLLKRKASTHFSEIVILTASDIDLTKSLDSAGFTVVTQDPQTLANALKGFKTPYYVLMSPRDEGVFAGQLNEPSDDIRVAQSFFAVRSAASFPSSCGNSLRVGSYFNPRALAERK